MTPDAYMRELAIALTRQEDLNDAEALDILFELALRIYALLLTLPTPQFERFVAWRRLRPQLLPLITAATDRLAPSFLSRLAATEQLLQPIHATYFSTQPLPPRPLPQLLDTTLVQRLPVSQLFVPTATGVTPFTAQLLRLLDRSVTAAFFRNDATPDLAARVIQPQRRAGITTPTITKGTVANAWRDRLRATLAEALWGLVAPTAQRYAATTAQAPEPRAGAAPAALGWRWNAVLDPKTCPICRPLHNTTAPSPNAFPGGPPPRHPACRCVVIPLRPA